MALRAIPDDYTERRAGRVRMIARDDVADALVRAGVLAGRPVEAWGEPVREVAGGRRPVRVVRVADIAEPVLVKEFRRGGLLGPLFGRVASPTRAFAELLVVESLRRAGVATPPILAVRVTRVAEWLPFVRIDLVLPFRVGASNLVDWLGSDPRPSDRRRGLEAAGRAVRAMHAARVRHEDLNLKNLLRNPDGSFEVIDLGASRVQPLTPNGRAINVARLYRSAVKLRLVAFERPSVDAARFLRGYDPSAWRDVAREVAVIARRSIPRHRWSWRMQRARGWSP